MSGKVQEGKSSSGAGSKSAGSTGKKKKGKKAVTLIRSLQRKLLVDRGRHCFSEWFSEGEVDSFRDNPDLTQLDPLFERYQVRMEAALEDFAADEGLTSTSEIIDALETARAENNEWTQLDKMIDTMTKKEEFFVMMQKRAVRQHTKRTGGGAGGKSGGGDAAPSSSRK